MQKKSKLTAWLLKTLSVLLVFFATASARFPDMDDPRWDPAAELILKEGLITELEENDSIDETELTLNWFYADGLRIGFDFHLSGISVPPETYSLNGKLKIVDGENREIQFTSIDGAIRLEKNGDISGNCMANLREDTFLPAPPFHLELIFNPETIDGAHRFWLEYAETRGTAPVSSAQQDVLAGVTMGPFMFSFEAPVYPVENASLDIETALNGISLRLINAKTTPSATFLALCYRNKNGELWSPIGDYLDENPLLKSGEYEALLKSWRESVNPLLQLWPVNKDALEIREGEFCGEFGFYLGKSHPSQDFQLVVPVMQLKLSDSEFIDKILNYQRDGVNPDVDFTYSYQIEERAISKNFDLIKYPDDMTEAEAYKAFYSQIGTLTSGPWNITFNMQ